MRNRLDEDQILHLRVAQQLAAMARARGIPLTEVARRSGVPYPTLCTYVQAGRKIPLATFLRICDAVGAVPGVVLEWAR